MTSIMDLVLSLGPFAQGAVGASLCCVVYLMWIFYTWLCTWRVRPFGKQDLSVMFQMMKHTRSRIKHIGIPIFLVWLLSFIAVFFFPFSNSSLSWDRLVEYFLLTFWGIGALLLGLLMRDLTPPTVFFLSASLSWSDSTAAQLRRMIRPRRVVHMFSSDAASLDKYKLMVSAAEKFPGHVDAETKADVIDSLSGFSGKGDNYRIQTEADWWPEFQLLFDLSPIVVATGTIDREMEFINNAKNAEKAFLIQPEMPAGEGEDQLRALKQSLAATGSGLKIYAYREIKRVLREKLRNLKLPRKSAKATPGKDIIRTTEFSGPQTPQTIKAAEGCELIKKGNRTYGRQVLEEAYSECHDDHSTALNIILDAIEVENGITDGHADFWMLTGFERLSLSLNELDRESPELLLRQLTQFTDLACRAGESAESCFQILNKNRSLVRQLDKLDFISPIVLAGIKFNLALCEQSIGILPNAQSLFEESLKIMKAVSGPKFDSQGGYRDAIRKTKSEIKNCEKVLANISYGKDSVDSELCAKFRVAATMKYRLGKLKDAKNSIAKFCDSFLPTYFENLPYVMQEWKPDADAEEKPVEEKPYDDDVTLLYRQYFPALIHEVVRRASTRLEIRAVLVAAMLAQHRILEHRIWLEKTWDYVLNGEVWLSDDEIGLLAFLRLKCGEDRLANAVKLLYLQRKLVGTDGMLKSFRKNLPSFQTATELFDRMDSLKPKQIKLNRR